MKRATLWCLILAMLAWDFAGCGTGMSISIPGITGSGETNQQQIAAVLDDVRRGMQSRRIYKVLSHVARSYHDADGRDYAGVEAYLRSIFDKYNVIRINRVPPRILVQGDRARVVETYGTLAEPINPAKNSTINMHGQITVYLQKISGAWQITEWANS